MLNLRHLLLPSYLSGDTSGSPFFGWLTACNDKLLTVAYSSLLSLLIILIIIYITPLKYSILMILFFSLGVATSSQIIVYPLVREHSPGL